MCVLIVILGFVQIVFYFLFFYYILCGLKKRIWDMLSRVLFCYLCIACIACCLCLFSTGEAYAEFGIKDLRNGEFVSIDGMLDVSLNSFVLKSLYCSDIYGRIGYRKDLGNVDFLIRKGTSFVVVPGGNHYLNLGKLTGRERVVNIVRNRFVTRGWYGERFIEWRRIVVENKVIIVVENKVIRMRKYQIDFVNVNGWRYTVVGEVSFGLGFLF